MTIEDADAEAKRRRFDELIEALTAGEIGEEDLTRDDLALLRELYGEGEEELQDLFENLRRLREEQA